MRKSDFHQNFVTKSGEYVNLDIDNYGFEDYTPLSNKILIMATRHIIHYMDLHLEKNNAETTVKYSYTFIKTLFGQDAATKFLIDVNNFLINDASNI